MSAPVSNDGRRSHRCRCCGQVRMVTICAPGLLGRALRVCLDCDAPSDTVAGAPQNVHTRATWDLNQRIVGPK